MDWIATYDEKITCLIDMLSEQDSTIVVLVLGATLMIDAQSVFAQTESRSMVSTDPGQLSELPHSHHPQADYQSGFQHGVTDGNRSSNATSYIDQPKHGFA
jgi:hypothetical protein